jgi:hypothetical protein
MELLVIPLEMEHEVNLRGECNLFLHLMGGLNAHSGSCIFL